MPVALLDLEEFARACAAGDVTLLAQRQGELGFVFDSQSLERFAVIVKDPNQNRIAEWGRPSIDFADVLSVMIEAGHGDIGIAIAEHRRWFGGKDVALAYRTATHLHVSVRYAPNIPWRVGDIWDGLSPWYKDLPRNRTRLDTWCAAPDDMGIISFPLAAGRSKLVSRATGEALLAAVVADPDNAGARLVYADWLVEQGDAQGQLIQLGEQRRHVEDRERIQQLAAEEKRLIEQFGVRIAGETGRLAKSYRLVRGFVDEIEMPAATFAKHFERLANSHPIRHLRLTTVNEAALERLARAPALAKLRSLELVGRSTPVPLNAFCASPHLASLESLTMSWWRVSPAPVGAFAGLQAPRLRTLSLRGLEPLNTLVAGLTDNPYVNLRFVNLAYFQSSAYIRADLFRARAFTEVETLDLSGPLTDAEAGGLLDMAWPELRQLRIHSDLLTTAGAASILAFQGAENLREISLRGDQLNTTKLMHFALALPASSTLDALSLPRPARRSEALAARFETRFVRHYEVGGD